MTALELPLIEEGQFRLRAFADADVRLIQEASRDALIPLISTVPTIESESEALDYINRQRLRLTERSGYSFAIADRSTNQAVGQIGLWIKNIDDGRASVGYWVAPSRRRQGVAQSALGILTRWAMSQGAVHRIELYVEPWNEGSWRAAEHCGYEREGLLRSWQDVGGVRKDMYMYALIK